MKLHEDSDPFDQGAPQGAADRSSNLGGHDYDLHFDDDEEDEESAEDDDEEDVEYDEDGNEIESTKEEELFGFSEESRD